MRHKSRTMFAALIAAFAVTALTAGSALAAGKPFVETRPATAIGETTATLNGVVNPDGVTTKYHFEYGITTSYGKSTTEVSVGSGTAFLEESKAITALTANTTYHFRVVATNSNGTSDGSDAVFTTTPKVGLPEFTLPKGEVFPATFTATIGNPAGISVGTSVSTFLECTGAKLKGELTNAKDVSYTDEMTGCRISDIEPACHTAGAPNEVVVVTGSGTVAYINKTTKRVGLVLTIKTGTITCEGIEEELRGSIIGPITPINTKTTSPEMRWEGNSGVETFTEYENEKSEKVLAHPELIAGFKEWADINVAYPFKFTMSKSITISA